MFSFFCLFKSYLNILSHCSSHSIHHVNCNAKRLSCPSWAMPVNLKYIHCSPNGSEGCFCVFLCVFVRFIKNISLLEKTTIKRRLRWRAVSRQKLLRPSFHLVSRQSNLQPFPPLIMQHVAVMKNHLAVAPNFSLFDVFFFFTQISNMYSWGVRALSRLQASVLTKAPYTTLLQVQ